MARSNVCSVPSGAVLKEIEKNTAKLFKEFSIRFLSDKTGISVLTIAAQKCRKKISQEAAISYTRIKEVKAAGFTKEMLRPDLRPTDWIVN